MLLKEIKTLKGLFTWKEIFSNAEAMKTARGPIRGYVTTLCFWALMQISFLEALSQTKRVSIQEFSQKHRLNSDLLTYLCNYLFRLGYLEKTQQQVSWSRKGARFWKKSSGVFHLFFAYEPLYSTLKEQLKNNKSFGKDLFRWEDEVAVGFAELGKSFLFKIMARIIQKEGFKSIVDLGCGEIELSSYLCEHLGPMHCLGIDHSAQALEGAQKKIQKLNLGSHIKIIKGDIFEIDHLDENFSSYQLVTAIDLFHGYFIEGEEKLLHLFRKLKNVFKEKKFLFSEISLPPDRGMKNITYPFAEHELFHNLTRQKTFKYMELELLLKEAGFEIKKTWDLNKIAGRTCLLLG